MRSLSLLPILVLTACPKATPEPAAAPTPSAASEAEYQPPNHAEGVANVALAGLLQGHWEAVMEASPTWASHLGDPRYDDRISDASEQAALAWQAREDDWLNQALGISMEGLNEADQLTLALFRIARRQSLAEQACRFRHWSILPRGNVLSLANGLSEDLALDTPLDGANLLARYRALPAHIDDVIAGLRLGLADDLAANAHSVSLVVEQLDSQLDAPVETWPMWTQIEVSGPWPEGREAAWRSDVRSALEQDVRPALVRFRALLRDDVLPVARPADQTGLAALELGPVCYGALVRRFTTLDTDADTVHQRGLDALEGIHAEFVELGGSLWDTKTLGDVFDRLRSDDPGLYFDTRDAVADKAASSLARAKTEMPNWFGRLPVAECTVQPIPDYQAPYTTIAYYRQPVPGERSGTYFINTWAPETRPKHEAEVLAFHESIPGHHLQIAISQELDAVPSFRRHGGFTAFVEGWALYTERLADQMGLYSGDLDRMGMLSFDAWRASRLVVDTGLHHKGWSRQQAVAFLAENTPLALNNIDNEVDRYITWPGQALGYKTGQMEIWALRGQAEAALGDGFDVRAFHDVVLGAGALTLPLLRERVEAWIAQEQGQGE
jgi:uncharacterized protein (DUF885 family)